MEEIKKEAMPDNVFVYKAMYNNMIYDGILQAIAYRILTAAVNITPELNAKDLYIDFEAMLKDGQTLPAYDMQCKNILTSSFSSILDRLEHWAHLVSNTLRDIVTSVGSTQTKLVGGTLRIALVPAAGNPNESGFNVALKLAYLQTKGDAACPKQ